MEQKQDNSTSGAANYEADPAYAAAALRQGIMMADWMAAAAAKGA